MTLVYSNIIFISNLINWNNLFIYHKRILRLSPSFPKKCILFQRSRKTPILSKHIGTINEGNDIGKCQEKKRTGKALRLTLHLGCQVLPSRPVGFFQSQTPLGLMPLGLTPLGLTPLWLGPNWTCWDRWSQWNHEGKFSTTNWIITKLKHEVLLVVQFLNRNCNALLG